ncbi:MAG: hypothetical protein R6U01_06400 [Halorubrum sp.]|uniref:hypothetical protein n=1 Tax=Halorubrum sp. TaxID=1879286 RepID=UPI003970EBEE
MSDTRAEIIIKGEIHTSNADLEEEREILVEGVDHLILEGQADEAEYSLTQQWYGWIMLIFQYLFARQIYLDHSILGDLADAQGAETEYTRETDLDILQNSHLLVQMFAVGLFFVILTYSLYVGIDGRVLQGSGWLFVSSLLPLLVLRVHESRRSEGGRDEMIAEQITEAAREGGRVVAVVGNEHAKNIPDYLSDDLPEPDVRPPKYPFLSIPSLKELLYPGFVFFSVLYIFYTVLLTYVQILHTPFT